MNTLMPKFQINVARWEGKYLGSKLAFKHRSWVEVSGQGFSYRIYSTFDSWNW